MDRASDAGQVPERHHTLDGLRGVAALLVAAYHLGLRYDQVCPEGYLAIDLFFALSGFVIALNYSSHLSRDMGVTRFMTVRLVRLYPLYALGLLFGLAKQATMFARHRFYMMTPDQLPVAVAAGVLMLPVPLGLDELYPFNPPSWSLLAELVVNLLFALVLFRLGVRWLALVAAACALAMVLTTAPPFFLNVGWSWATLAQGMARAGFSFAVGLLLWRHVGGRAPGVSLLAAALPVLLAVPLCLTIGDGSRVAYELAVVLVVLPALLFVAVRVEPPMRWRPVFGFLGDVSYAAYAVHLPLVSPAGALLRRAGIGGWAGVALFDLVVVLLAWAAVRLVDAPVRRLLSRLLRIRRTAPPQVVA